jgi:hypothetical protein
LSVLNLRLGGRLPNGFLLPLNLSKVLEGLPALPVVDLLKVFLPAKLPDFLGKLLADFPAKPWPDLLKDFFAPKVLLDLRV